MKDKFQKFGWDYPSQGMRYPRTMNEAFGPYAKLHVEPEHRPATMLEVLLYLTLLAAVLAVIFF